MELTPEIVDIFLSEGQFDLLSTQTKICFPILKRIYDKLKNGKRFKSIKIEGNIIIEGHHRYICYSLLDLDIETINWTRSPSIDIVQWSEVYVDRSDWETKEQIDKINKDEL